MEDEMEMLVAREDPSSVGQSAIVFPPPRILLVFKQSCNPGAATHFSDIVMHTLFLEKNNTMVKILKERNGWIGVALKLCF